VTIVYQAKNTGMSIVTHQKAAWRGTKTRKHKRRTPARVVEESYTRSPSANQPEEKEEFVQERPEAALIAAQAYLLTTQQKPGDPRE
jgi:hypothetical protein